ncbi:MAG: hypothetical protein Q8P20_07705 [bacterium]|nr:hypothetical protein [bacterium]
MTEEITRRDLPRFKKEGFKVARVVNVAREKVEGRLPPLMDDTRANYLARVAGEKEDIYVKAVASPWTGEHGIHFLVIPDRMDHENIPGIADLSPEALGRSLQLAESLAYHTLQQMGISEVDFGINHSRGELKRGRKSILASIPLNLHIHVTGYNPQDLEPLSTEDIIKSSEITGRTSEALYVLGEQLLFEEIIPELKTTFPSFGDVFTEIRDQRSRKRFKMTEGRKGFQHPDLPKILQAMDEIAKRKYDELAKCFFEFDDSSNQFVTKQDELERYKLLGRETRLQNIEQYIENHRGLSRGVKLGLTLLASIAKDEQVVVERELGILEQKRGIGLTEEEREVQIGHIANRFWAYKDLAYALVWSAQKENNGEMTWIMGFNPKVFTIHGPHQSSAHTNKLVERDISGHFTPEQLQAVQQREMAVLVQTKEEIKALELKG